MAKKKITGIVAKIAGWLGKVGRGIGGRRVLFAWSAACVAISAFSGVFESIQIYNNHIVDDLGAFTLVQFLEALFMFVKLFTPMFLIVIATKYIFDSSDKHKATATLKLSFAASLAVGLAAGAFFYLDAGHIIGSGAASKYCAGGSTCLFSWDIAKYVGLATTVSTVIMLAIILGLRGIYNELSFMLHKPNK
jgi:hypothetical protein